MDYDVVIVGASISGCTAAVHLGRAGLRVAVLEKHRSIETPKRLCGHFLLGGAREPLRRLGIWDELIGLGAGTGRLAMWCDRGWLANRSGTQEAPPFLDVRRSSLDPRLRRIAAETAGVDLLLGHTVDSLVYDGGRVVGVAARELDGASRELRARLVVGADGHRSRTAALAGAAERTFPNARAFLYGYYRDVPWQIDGDAAVWWHGDDWVVLSPTDGGLTEVALMPARADVPAAGARGLADYVEDYLRRLPGGPDLMPEQRASKLVASLDYPLIRRDPVPAPGLALVGDAALTADPAPAPGCTWALLSGQWLAEETADALASDRSGDRSHRAVDAAVDAALRGYRRRRRALEREFFFMRSDAASGRTNPVQRMLREAAVQDPVTAERLLRVGMQVAPTTSVLRPGVLGRAWVARRRSRRTRATGPTPTPTDLGRQAARLARP